MPEHLNSTEEIENAFPDDSQFGTTTWYGRFYRWYQKKTKTWFAFSYRCTEWWARWRKYPKVLLAVCSKNHTFRYENEQGDGLDIEWRRILINRDVKIWKTATAPDGAPVWDVQPAYLSRIQYYSRWHFSIQWPLMITFHFYFKEKDVPSSKPNAPREDVDGKLLFFYWNHFDADLVYWMITSFVLGTGWK